jgi:hypothetical protein
VLSRARTGRLDVTQWLLYSNPAIWAGKGLAQGQGQVFTQDGRLVASYSVQAMIRACRRASCPGPQLPVSPQREWRSRWAAQPGTRSDGLVAGLARYFLPGHAASHACWLLSDDIRARARILVADLDQNPALLPGPRQPEAARKLSAMQHKRQMRRLVAHDLGRSLIPDDHRASAPPLAGVNTLEISCRHRVVLDRHRQPPDPGVKRGPPGHRPRAQHLARLDPEVVMQPRGIVQLHDEPP